MRNKKQRIVCIMLAVFAFLFGMCLEHIKADSPLVYAPIQQNSFLVKAYDENILDAEFCTMEMLGVRNSVILKQLEKSYHNPPRQIDVSYNFLCSNVFSLQQRKFFTSSETLNYLNQFQDELVSNFIHKSDGKKRI